MRSISLLAPLLAISVLAAQRPPDNGPRQIDPGWHALVGATVIPEAGRRITDATVVIKDGRIVSLVPGGSAPAGARVWDCSGMSIYPGLIDAHVPVEAPAPEPNTNGNHWNAKVMPQRSALDGNGITAADAKKLRELGFTSAVITPKGGIFTGKAAVVLLDEPRTGEQRRVLAKDVFQEIDFGGGRGFGGGYPGSQMGVIALIRQTFFDANWRAAKMRQQEQSNGTEMPMPMQDSLDSLLTSTPLLFNTSDELEILRAAKIAQEFSRPAMLVGSGFEFRRIQPIAALGMPIILPINFPKPPAVDTILERQSASLSALMAWEQAPTNPQRLIDSGVAIALTTDKLSDRGSFFDHLRKAIEHGFSEDDALKALTETPASLVNMPELIGKVAPGYMANLILVEGNLFDKGATIRESWIQGRRHVIKAADHLDLVGSWQTELDLAGISIDNLEFSSNKSLKVHSGEKNVAAKKLKLGRNRLDFLIDAEKLGGKGIIAVNAVVEGNRMFGTGIAPDGSLVNWQGMHSASATEASAKKETDKRPSTSLGKDL
ncbi:MAG: amidohydrolase family protein, partial [Planctomycetota bacterium]